MTVARALAVVLLLVAAAPAEASWTRIAQGASDVATDGERYAVWLHGRRTLAVRDDSGGTRRRIALPDACRRAQSVVAGSGRAAVSCARTRYGRADVFVTDLENGATTQVPDTEVSGDTDTAVRAVGRHWILIAVFSYHTDSAYWANIATGETSGGGETARAGPDPDTVDLVQPLCRPVRRRPTPDDGITATDPFLPAWRTGDWVVRDARPLDAWRCGERRPVVLDRCRPAACDQVQAGGGLVSWLGGGKAVVVRLEDGARRAVALPRLSPSGFGHTRAALYRSNHRGRGQRILRLPLRLR